MTAISRGIVFTHRVATIYSYKTLCPQSQANFLLSSRPRLLPAEGVHGRARSDVARQQGQAGGCSVPVLSYTSLSPVLIRFLSSHSSTERNSRIRDLLSLSLAPAAVSRKRHPVHDSRLCSNHHAALPRRCRTKVPGRIGKIYPTPLFLAPRQLASAQNCASNQSPQME
jgi:hypothetical protein